MLMTFAASVSVYRLEDSEMAAAECFPGNKYPPEEMLKVMTHSALEGKCIAPLHSCRKMAEQAIASFRYLLLLKYTPQSQNSF